MIVMCVVLHVGHGFTDEEKQNAVKLLESMAQTRKGIGALREVVDGIDGDLLKTQRVRELQTKRQGLDLMKRILAEMDTDLMQEQKRTCALNLGGHCSTESAASMSDQWHYLNSPLSPGRKRRDTGLYKKLISGELLPSLSHNSKADDHQLKTES